MFRINYSNVFGIYVTFQPGRAPKNNLFCQYLNDGMDGMDLLKGIVLNTSPVNYISSDSLSRERETIDT